MRRAISYLIIAWSLAFLAFAASFPTRITASQSAPAGVAQSSVTSETIIVSDAPVGLLAATRTPAGVAARSYCSGVVEIAPIVFRVDGANPASGGILASVGDTVQLGSPNDLQNFRATRTTRVNGRLSVTCLSGTNPTPTTVARLEAGAAQSDSAISTQPAARAEQGSAGALPLPVTSAGATYVGSETCAQCHYDKFVSYMNQPHSQGGDPRTPAARNGCESCHGPASNHIKGGGGRTIGGMMTFAKTVPTAARNEVCLQCHTRGATALWHGSAHDERKLACMDCHAVHGGNPKLLQQPTQQQLCTSCHQQVRQALAKSSHHPLREEKLQCTSCHNPHGTQAPRLISANSINDKCYECHAEKRGPFLYEHPPVRENCLNCHDPHGSSHPKLLVMEKPLLCQRCHANMNHPGIPYALSTEQKAAGVSVYQLQPQDMYRSCTNCHVAIHGTNSPSGKFWHR